MQYSLFPFLFSWCTHSFIISKMYRNSSSVFCVWALLESKWAAVYLCWGKESQEYYTRRLSWMVTTNTAWNLELLIDADRFQNIINWMISSDKDTQIFLQVFPKSKKNQISTGKMFWIRDFLNTNADVMETKWEQSEKLANTKCFVRIVIFYHYQR